MCDLMSIAVVPNIFGNRDPFRERQFFHRQGRERETGSGAQAVMQVKLCSLTWHSFPVQPGS